MEQVSDVEVLLEQGKTVEIIPQGYSMYPFFVPKRDRAVLRRADPDRLKRGDVVLYRRAPETVGSFQGGLLVLHRIWKRKADGFYLLGDNQKEIEGPIQADQIKGILIALIRKGKAIPADDPVYAALSSFWLFLRPLRRMISVSAASLKKALRRILSH